MSLRSVIPHYPHRANKLLTPPAEEPVSAAELRAHLITDDTDLPDASANSLIEEARQFIEDMTGLALIEQSWTLVMDRWPGEREEWWDGVREGAMCTLYAPDYRCAISVPRYPLMGVTSTKVYDEDSVSTDVVVADTFDLDTFSTPGRINLKHGAVWPIAMRPTNAIEIVYTAGYGADASAVPATLKRAVKLLASKMYSTRGDGCNVEGAYESSGAKNIVDAYRDLRI